MYTTIEAELKDGRIIPLEPREIPMNGKVLLTIMEEKKISSNLEHEMRRTRPIPAFKAFKGAFPLTNEFIDAAKREGRV